MSNSIRSLVVMTVAAGIGFADDKPKADPSTAPLELTISGKVTTFTLDPGADKKKIEDSEKAGVRMPPTPVVDLMAEIKNTSDKPVTVWVTGDPVVLTLEVKGKGAVNAKPQLAFTQEFRIPKAIEIAPGKSHSIPIKNLNSGFRGASQYSYWTQPGDYELVATLKTGVSPAPKGAKDAGEGFGVVTLTSAPLKVKVEKK